MYFREFAWKWFCRTVMFVTGWTYEVNPHYREEDRQIVVFPHTSGWELAGALLVRDAHELKNVKIIVWNGQFKGVMGDFLKWLGCTPIENQKSTGAVTNISNYLNKEGKFKFCISPEGSRDYREKFRSGFFYIAQNTSSIYNVVSLDYEKHIFHFGHLVESTGDFQTDCDNLAEIFGKTIPLHPECTFYGSAPHSHTSMINWIRFDSVVATLVLWYTQYYFLAGLSLSAFLTTLI